MNPVRPLPALSRRLLIGAALGAMASRAAALAPLPRILAFGDSLTAGYGLKPGEGLVPRLGGWLEDRGRPARLLDGGLSGDTTYGGRVRIGWSLRKGADAVIVQLGGNDMLTRIPPHRAEANLDAILARAGGEGRRPVLLAGIRTPDNHPQRRNWAALWPRLAARHGCLLLADLYAPLAEIPESRRAGYLLADGLHPSAKGVGRIVAGLGPKVMELMDRMDRRGG